MSSQRSTSGQGFRELRARFESQSSDERNLSPLRGQSPIDNTSSASRSPVGRQRIRTSFVSVEPSGHQTEKMASNTEQKHDGSISTAERRPSFSMADNPEAVNALKKTVSNEAERRKSVQDNPIPETAVSSALPTPIPESPEPVQGLSAPGSARPPAKGMASSSSLKSVTLPETEKQSEHQEKSVSALEDQEAQMRPSDVKSTEVVSGGKADGQHPAPQLNGQTEEGQVEAPKAKATTKSSKPQTASKPPATRPSAAASIQKPSKPVINGTRPTSAGKSSATMGTAASANRRKPSPQTQKTSPDSKRTKPVPLPSHLTAPTASSKAKNEPEPSNGRVTSGSRPLQSTSHLMAPTAASKAKHEPEGSPTSSSGSSTLARPAQAAAGKKDRTSMASSAGPAANRKPAPRSSMMGRSNGVSTRQSEIGGAKPPASSRTAAPGFLDRMTKPTAATSSKTHDKAVNDEPSAATKLASKASVAPIKPMVNGVGSSDPAKPSSKPTAASSSRTHDKSLNDKHSAATKPAPRRSVAPTKPVTNGVGPAGPTKASSKTAAAQQPAKKVGAKPAMPNQTEGLKSTTKASTSAAMTPSPTVPRSQKKHDSQTPSGASPRSSPSQARKKGKPLTPAKGQGHPPQPPQAPQQHPALSNTDGQKDSQSTDWNAAALPLTPQSQKKNDQFDAGAVPTAELPNGTAATTHKTAKTSADMAIRRSMMETPEVEEETIR